MRTKDTTQMRVNEDENFIIFYVSSFSSHMNEGSDEGIFCVCK